MKTIKDLKEYVNVLEEVLNTSKGEELHELEWFIDVIYRCTDKLISEWIEKRRVKNGKTKEE